MPQHPAQGRARPCGCPARQHGRPRSPAKPPQPHRPAHMPVRIRERQPRRRSHRPQRPIPPRRKLLTPLRLRHVKFVRHRPVRLKAPALQPKVGLPDKASHADKVANDPRRQHQGQQPRACPPQDRPGPVHSSRYARTHFSRRVGGTPAALPCRVFLEPRSAFTARPRMGPSLPRQSADAWLGGRCT